MKEEKVERLRWYMTKPREAIKINPLIDNYCENYRDLFKEVRTFEGFKYLHLGIISSIKRKTLPEIAKIVGLEDFQNLHNVISSAEWSADELKETRLEIILKWIAGEEIEIIIDETGDRKKGETTDYVKRQYIGNLGKVENGIVSVNAYGIYQGIAIPLISKIYKPKERLKEGDGYKSKPEIAGEIIKELKKKGFKIKLVLGDSLYGESESNFISVLNEEKLEFAVAIRSNHGLWLPLGQKVRVNKWRKYTRKLANSREEIRYIREIIFGKKREIRYWEVTTDKEKLPENDTWNIMTKIQGVRYEDVGNIYGLRNWVEYGFKQSKNELGWSDFRLTKFSHIEKWWEIVMSAYLMISLQVETLNQLEENTKNQDKNQGKRIKQHPQWDQGKGWKDQLNNIRLFLEPLCCFNKLKPWFVVLFSAPMIRMFCRLFFWLIRAVNSLIESIFSFNFYFSSA
jgi:SRSO17 transposase